MIDPKALFIRHTTRRLAKIIASRKPLPNPDIAKKIRALEALENHYSIKLTESQITSALLMENGCFAELATGEGKTYSIALCAAWLSLAGRAVHVVTPNEYLSKRDYETLNPFYKTLGLTSECIDSSVPPDERFALYQNDIVYSTLSTLAFDRMRQRSRVSLYENYQKIENASLIIDESDAILIENGSVPFIFARNIDAETSFWIDSVNWVSQLDEDSFEYDIQTESTFLSDRGFSKFEGFLVDKGYIHNPHELYRARNSRYFHRIMMAVRAVRDFKENVDYLIIDNKISILNQSTGRIERDRQWGEGLHQAIEAKHNLPLSEESEVVSKITVPEVLELYSHFSGTSATISHASDEIFKRYGRLTIKVDRSHPDQRIFKPDQCYDSIDLKHDVIVRSTRERHEKGQPVLIGVETIEEAITLHHRLLEESLNHSLLTAKHEDKEASIIAEAGLPGSITIATNMAGRGTDIRLGGSTESLKSQAVDKGGLCVIGASRQLERRLDDQLAGRCGRQGDPGVVQFYLSLGDKLFKDQDKITSIRKITKRSLLGLQKSKANKISVSRDEIDAFNEVYLRHKDIFFKIRDFWYEKTGVEAVNELLELFTIHIRELLIDYGINKKYPYKDIDGFWSEISPLTDKVSNQDLYTLDSQYSENELCSEIEKLLILSASSKIQEKETEDLRADILNFLDDAWSNHIVLLEQIYDHAKWQSLIQKNDRIQFSIFGFEAMEDFVLSLESRLIEILFKV